MKEKERTLVTGLVLLMLILWLGFAVHRSPRFAGSFVGGMLGLGGGVLMLVPLAYMIVKRVKPLKRRITRIVTMRTLLSWHIYAGVGGPILGLLHTGHKFDSSIGIALTALMILVVFSGFTGRYLMNQISREIRELSRELDVAKNYYDTAVNIVTRNEDMARWTQFAATFRFRLLSMFFMIPPPPNSYGLTEAVRLAESISDLEYALKSQQMFKKLFSIWLSIHIMISLLLYVLLGFHIFSGIYFGLRWFQ